MSYTVLITDRVAPICIDLLEQQGMEANVQLETSPEELEAHVREADGWIVRSGTKVTEALVEVADRLKVIGRAGVGVDNIDLEAATRRGVLVINAPDGNTISTAEHSCAMLMAMARRIPQANASLVEGQWDRKAFTGSELYEKTLGIVGVGKIGRAVAERMQGFGMTILGHDPVLSQDVADRLGMDLVGLDDLVGRSDFITIHTPLNDETRGLFDRERIGQCKPSVRIVNCARGGIVEEKALLEALEQGHVAGAALDVYSQEPPPPGLKKLIQHPNVVATPHIAASTDEAQEKVARQVTEQVIRALDGEPVHTPVNAMAIRMASQREVQPFLQLADKLGQVGGQLTEGHLKRVAVTCHGDVPHRYAEVITVAALKGVLARWIEEPVNFINAPFLAEELGLRIEEKRDTVRGSYTNLIEIELETDAESHTFAGTIFGERDSRLVRIDTYSLEVKPKGRLLFYKNVDRPGMLAAVGATLAKANINIGALALGRTGKGAQALTAISVDEDIPGAVLEEISTLDGVEHVRCITV